MNKFLTLLMLLALYFAAYVRGAQSQDPEVIWLIRVKQHDTFDFKGMEFFELRRGGGNEAEAPLLTVSSKSDLAAFLRRQEGKLVTISFRGE
jgi:hypothetical protein